MVDATDPPHEVSGMTLVVLDTEGRLTYFEAVPPQVYEEQPGAATTNAEAPTAGAATNTGATAPNLETARPDWATLFADAGLDFNSFRPAPSRWTPPQHADARAAWEGTYADRPDMPLRVEAASHRGPRRLLRGRQPVAQARCGRRRSRRAPPTARASRCSSPSTSSRSSSRRCSRGATCVWGAATAAARSASRSSSSRRRCSTGSSSRTTSRPPTSSTASSSRASSRRLYTGVLRRLAVPRARTLPPAAAARMAHLVEPPAGGRPPRPAGRARHPDRRGARRLPDDRLLSGRAGAGLARPTAEHPEHLFGTCSTRSACSASTASCRCSSTRPSPRSSSPSSRPSCCSPSRCSCAGGGAGIVAGWLLLSLLSLAGHRQPGAVSLLLTLVPPTIVVLDGRALRPARADRRPLQRPPHGLLPRHHRAVGVVRGRLHPRPARPARPRPPRLPREPRRPAAPRQQVPRRLTRPPAVSAAVAARAAARKKTSHPAPDGLESADLSVVRREYGENRRRRRLPEHSTCGHRSPRGD